MKQFLEQQRLELSRARARNEAAQSVNILFELEREFNRVFVEDRIAALSTRLSVEEGRGREPGDAHDLNLGF